LDQEGQHSTENLETVRTGLYTAVSNTIAPINGATSEIQNCVRRLQAGSITPQQAQPILLDLTALTQSLATAAQTLATAAATFNTATIGWTRSGAQQPAMVGV
jgi:deferrochelatase/peroxidase EfeB